MSRSLLLLIAVAGLTVLGGVALLSLGPGDDTPEPSPGPVGNGGHDPVPPNGGEPPVRDDSAVLRILGEYAERLGMGLPGDPVELLILAQSEAGGAVLLRAWAATEDLDKKAVLLTVMVRSPDPKARALVTRMAGGAEGPELRLVGLLALGDALPETDLGPLRDAALGEEDPAVAGAALQSLSYRSDPESKEILLAALHGTTDPDRRRLIWSALGGEPLPPGEGEPPLAVRLREQRRTPIVPDPETEKSDAAILLEAERERSPEGVMFAGTAALQLRLQVMGFPVPYPLMIMLPYVVAMIALVGIVSKADVPAYLAKPFKRE